tara:strand:- start:100 stop:996 length:897 start_codon:yes stop_codon:yes gene_type:complete
MTAASIPFIKEMAFEYGVAQEIIPGVRRIVAPNPSPFTFKGTNTYIIGYGEVALIDPGPLLEQHVENIKRALRKEAITHIFVTHSHIDHSPAADRIREITGAPVIGSYPIKQSEGMPVEAAQENFVLDRELVDGEVINSNNWSLEAIYTPGHMSNHYCYALKKHKLLFSGDHVMGWNTTIVSPPDGNMGQYLGSLNVCLKRDEELYLPGHGPAIRDTKRFVSAYLNHRIQREKEIMVCLERGLTKIPNMVASMYSHLPKTMHGAAARSVLAHLEHLVETGAVKCAAPISSTSTFTVTR